MHILILSHDLAENAVGRAHVLWELARHCGHTATVAGPQRGQLWAPVRDSDFARSCVSLNRWPQRDAKLPDLVAAADLIIAVKTWPASLGVALRSSRTTGTPLVLDIDEDDFGALLGQDADIARRLRSVIRGSARGTNVREFHRLQSVARSWPHVLVSNPTLLNRFPTGHVIPHAREVLSTAPSHSGARLRVGFVGTVRRHKGFRELREAVQNFEGEISLVITADQRGSQGPREEWVGATSLESGRELLRTCNVLIAPSRESDYGATQLPAKLIDAMALGVVPVATDTPVTRWALENGQAGVLIEDQSVESIRAALSALRDSRRRTVLSRRALERARLAFSQESVARKFEAAVLGAFPPPGS